MGTSAFNLIFRVTESSVEASLSHLIYHLSLKNDPGGSSWPVAEPCFSWFLWLLDQGCKWELKLTSITGFDIATHISLQCTTDLFQSGLALILVMFSFWYFLRSDLFQFSNMEYIFKRVQSFPQSPAQADCI